jgi:WD40 repeat protein
MSFKIQKIADFVGHRDCIYSLEKSKSVHHFFSASGDGMVVQWDIENPENGVLITKLSNSIYAMKLIEDQNRLLLAENFEGLHEIDLDNNKKIHSLKLAATYFFDIQIFKNLALIACGNGNVLAIDLQTFTIIDTINTSLQSARTISINPLVKEFAVGFSDHTIRIFSLEDFKLLKEIKYHTNSVFSVSFSSDYKLLFTTGRDAHIAIWDCWNHYELLIDIPAHNFAINHLIPSPNGQYFVSGSMDKTVKVWKQEDFKLLKVLDKTRSGGHSSSINKLLWINNTNQFLSTGDDKKITLWQIE